MNLLLGEVDHNFQFVERHAIEEDDEDEEEGLKILIMEKLKQKLQASEVSRVETIQSDLLELTYVEYS